MRNHAIRFYLLIYYLYYNVHLEFKLLPQTGGKINALC